MQISITKITNMLTRNITCFLLGLVPCLVWGKTLYTCTNNVAEILCHKATCVARQSDFTPTHIHISSTNVVNICIYSGCWEAQVKPIQKNNHIIYSSERFQLDGSPRQIASFLINIRPKTKLGFLQGDQVLLPLQCN